jgi:hypothetical protein
MDRWRPFHWTHGGTHDGTHGGTHDGTHGGLHAGNYDEHELPTWVAVICQMNRWQG